MKAVLINPSLLNVSLDYERDAFGRHGIEFAAHDVQDEPHYAECCREAHAVMVLLQPTPRSVIEKLAMCRVIVSYGVGYDHIDAAACGERDIALCNIPGYCSQEVAAHAVALALACLRKVPLFDRLVRAGVWDNTRGYPLRRLAGQTFGLCGFGAIAQNVADMIGGFGFTRIGCDPRVDDDTFRRHGVAKVPFDELCSRSDIISLHAALTPETTHLLDYPQFLAMKKGVIIVNTARGALINEAALAQAIDAGIVKAAALDVLEREPRCGRSDSPLARYDNVVLTPHAGVQSEEAIAELRRRVVETVIAVLKGEGEAGIVNHCYPKF